MVKRDRLSYCGIDDMQQQFAPTSRCLQPTLHMRHRSLPSLATSGMVRDLLLFGAPLLLWQPSW